MNSLFSSLFYLSYPSFWILSSLYGRALSASNPTMQCAEPYRCKQLQLCNSWFTVLYRLYIMFENGWNSRHRTWDSQIHSVRIGLDISQGALVVHGAEPLEGIITLHNTHLFLLRCNTLLLKCTSWRQLLSVSPCWWAKVKALVVSFHQMLPYSLMHCIIHSHS